MPKQSLTKFSKQRNPSTINKLVIGSTYYVQLWKKKIMYTPGQNQRAKLVYTITVLLFVLSKTNITDECKMVIDGKKRILNSISLSF